MATLQEIIAEAEKLFPDDPAKQQDYYNQNIERLGKDPTSQELLGTMPKSVEEVKFALEPTPQNADFVKRIENAKVFEQVTPPESPVRAATTTLVGKPTPSPAQPKDEDIDNLINMVEMFGPNKPTRIEGYTDDQLEAIIDMNASNAVEAREELELRRTGDLSHKANRLTGQVTAGAAEAVTSGPIAATGLVAKGMEFLTGQNLNSDALLKAADEISKSVRAELGISEPRDIVESLASITGSLVPLPTPKGTGVVDDVPDILKGVDTTLRASDVYKRLASSAANLVEVATPLVIGSSGKRVAANFVTAAIAEQGIRELADTAETDYKTAFDLTGLTGPDDSNYPTALGGILTGLGIFTGASVIAPMAVRALRDSPTWRQKDNGVLVSDVDLTAPSGLRSIERPKDLYKAQFVDAKQVMVDLLDRAGVSNFEEVAKQIDNDTQMNAVMRVNEAMRVGKLRTKQGAWDVEVTPMQLLDNYRRLPAKDQENVDLYLKYSDLIDVYQSKIDIASKKLKADGISNDDFLRVSQELDEAQQGLITARRNANAAITAAPMAGEFATVYQNVINATRGFLASGESAMLSPETLQSLQKFRKNFVPSDIISIDPTKNVLKRMYDATRPVGRTDYDKWITGAADTELDITKRVNSFEVLVDYTHAALLAKMHNDARSAYSRAMTKSTYGSGTMIPATKKDAEKWPNRIVEVWEGGKKKRYLSSQLQADLIKLDTYAPKWPVIYGLKRMAEMGATGVASMTFAPYILIRDSILGEIIKQPGTKGPLGKELLFAPVKQAWAKAQIGMIDALQKNMDRVPFLDDAGKQELAKQLSNSYMNSIYHLANESGGIDASMLRSNIQQGNRVFRELAKSIGSTTSVVPGMNTLGHSAAVLAHGISNLYNILAEMPRFATFERNVKAGKTPQEAASLARGLTGDVTRSGRSYTRSGRRISADVKRPELLLPSPVTGLAAEAARESILFVNPMIQGTRRLANALINDPVGVNLNAWKFIGLPTMAIMAWNETLGEEYNKYNFEGRSSRDIAMNLPSIGIPGRPPEEGIQIPIAHELMLFNSPWSSAIYALMNGSDADDIKKSMIHMGLTSLENSVTIGVPQIAALGGAAMGVRVPSNWTDNAYMIREDNAGLLPTNVEILMRNMFSSVADTANMTALAFYEGGMEAGVEEFMHTLAKRTPIVKNLTGNTPTTSNFTPISEQKQTKVNALQDFLTAYDEHVMKPTQQRVGNLDKVMPTDVVGEYLGGLSSEQIAGDLPDTKEIKESVEDDVYTTNRMAPIPSPKPTNPVFLEYGNMIKDVLDRNTIGIEGLNGKMNLLRDQVRDLRQYTAGRKDKFRNFQKSYTGADQKYQQALNDLNAKRASMTKKEIKAAEKGLMALDTAASVDRLINKELKLDLSKRSDVNKLINHLENERNELMKEYLKVIEMVEDTVTRDMTARGILPPGKKFKIEDLKPW